MENTETTSPSRGFTTGWGAWATTGVSSITVSGTVTGISSTGSGDRASTAGTGSGETSTSGMGAGRAASWAGASASSRSSGDSSPKSRK